MNNQIRQWTKNYISAVVEKQQVEDPEEPNSDQYQVELDTDPNGAQSNPLEHADPMADPIMFGDEDEDEDHLHPASNGSLPSSSRNQTPGPGASDEPDQSSNRTKWQKFKQRFPYYVPIFYWLPHYNWKRDFTKDLVAGLGVASMIIPQSLACAILATVDPIYGLYTALFPGLIYAFMGTSRQLSVGPDAMIALLVALELSHLRERSEELVGHGGEEHEFDANLTSHALSFLVGLFLFGAGLIRVGFLDNIFSRALLGGFVNAVALIIIFEQLDVLFGIKDKDAGPEDHGWKKLPYLFEHLGEHCPNNLLLGNCVHLPTMTAAFISISFMIGMRLIKKHTGKLTGMGWIKFVPENLIVIIIAIIVSYSAKLEENYHMKILGDMDAKFPVPQFPHFGSTANFKLDLTAAGTISVIGFIESIVVAKLYANKNNYYVSPNRELVAVGLSNFVGSFFQTFPTFGSLTRSSVADMMGAQTQLFTLITSFVILLTIFLLGPLFAFLPKVVMSSIIFVAATGLFEFEDVEFMWKIKAWKDLFLFLLTFAMTVILGVDLGIFLSIGISLFFVVKYSSLPHLGILGRVPETKKYKDIKQVAEARVIPGILIVRIEEALYFANVEMIKQMLSRIERVGNPKAHPGDKRRGWTLHSIIIHSRNIPDMDASAIQVLAEMVEKYHERGIFVCFVKLREKLRHLFVRAHIIENAHSDIRLFESTDDAVTFVEDRVQRGEHDGTDIAEHGEH